MFVDAAAAAAGAAIQRSRKAGEEDKRWKRCKGRFQELTCTTTNGKQIETSADVEDSRAKKLVFGVLKIVPG